MKQKLLPFIPIFGYAVVVSLVWLLLAPRDLHVWVPIYEEDTLHLGMFGAILFFLGVAFVAFSVFGLSRGSRRGVSGVLLGCAAPMATGSPVALVLSLPTLVLAYHLLRSLAANRR